MAIMLIMLGGLLDPIAQEYGVPAMAAAVIQQDDLIAMGVTGTRTQGEDSPVTEGDLWHVGSCTKSMTAALCATAVEEGLLRWDTTPGEAFPELEDAIDPALEGITLEMLLRHRAGLDPYTEPTPELEEFLGSLEVLEPRKQRMVATAKVLSEPPLHEPGTTYEYSNMGYTVATAMVERALDESWEDLILERVLQPLGIHGAQVGFPAADDDSPQPWGHLPTEDGFQPWPPSEHYALPPVIAPAGDLSLTIQDFAVWSMWYLVGAAGEDTPILTAESFEKLTDGVPTQGDGLSQYAMGIAPMALAGHEVLWHNGSAGTFFAWMTILPEEEAAIVVATNAGGDDAEAACKAATLKLIEEIVDKVPGEAMEAGGG
ncbi:MAG: serine hydrolase [Armatimonadia bacterium]|nr:serine hydrolase [Armatimonadia bacterium]